MWSGESGDLADARSLLISVNWAPSCRRSSTPRASSSCQPRSLSATTSCRRRCALSVRHFRILNRVWQMADCELGKHMCSI